MFAAGTRIGPYELVREIGAGGHGVVWMARHTSLGRQVAIKLLKPELAADADLLRRFFIEARAAASVDHPGIVSVFDVGDGKSGAYIAMEYLTGESLGSCLRRGGPLAISRVVALAHQVASALVAVHAAGVLHRDLKPDNLFLVADDSMPQGERIKILDFGIAKLRPGPNRDVEATGEPLTRQGVVIGTPTYMAPEQCRGNQPLDERTDVYALGCVVFRMLTGRAPFDATSPNEVIAAHLLTLPPAVESLRADIPPALARLVATCLEKDPARRPQDMQAVANILDGLRDRPSRDAVTPTIPPALDTALPTMTRTVDSDSRPAPAPETRRPRWLVPGSLAVAVLAGVLGVRALGGGTMVTPDAAPSPIDAAPVIPDAALVISVDAAPAAIDAAPSPIDAAPARPRPSRPRPAVIPPAMEVTPIDAGPPPRVKPRIGDDSLDPFDDSSRRQR